MKRAYGNTIEAEVTRFYNLFDPQDNLLEYIYQLFEGNSALGEDGKRSGLDEVATPPYYDINVQAKIEPIGNSDGIADQHLLWCRYFSSDLCEVTIKDYDVGLCAGYVFSYGCSVERGDNHAGYMGFRSQNNPNTLASDSSMKVIIDSWRN